MQKLDVSPGESCCPDTAFETVFLAETFFPETDFKR